MTAADRRLAVIAAAVILLSCLYVFHNYRAAFPQASLDLKLSKNEITARAEAFLKSRKLNVQGYRNLTLFSPDDDARLFLEREAGLEQANKLMSGEVVVWQWRARWYRPPEKEEFRVWLTPDGRTVAMDHIIAEDAKGASLSRDDARTVAQTVVPAGYRLVEERSENKPNRVDHFFEWEREGFSLKGATYRRAVTVRGGEIGAFREYLKVPEQWQRDFSAMRSRNELYSQIAQGFYVPLILAGLVVLIQAVRAGQVRWARLVKACGVLAVLMALNQWNTLPFSLDSLPTSTRLDTAIPLLLLQGVGAGVAVFFYVILAAAPGETLYRRLLPNRLSVSAAFSRRALDTREFFRASVTGYAMAAGHIAFITAFYLIGQRFGVWSPQDVEYSDLLSTALPWLYPLTIALMAATSEEAWFRLLAIPLLARIGLRRSIAVIVPAFVWGFLHANYPQQPAWIRGVEVGAIGVVAGMVMLRFGILATLVWHYTVDAVLMGSFLFQSSDWYLRGTGLLVGGVVLLPLAVSLYRYRRHAGFLVDPAMTNAADPHQPATAEEEHPSGLLPPIPATLSPRILFAVAALLGLAALFVHPKPYGDFIRLRINRDEALRLAGPPPKGWQTSIEFVTNLPVAELEYVRRNGGDPNEVARTKLTPAVWRIRHFQPLNKQERWIFISPEGRLLRTDLILDEDAPGANLEQPAARELAERYLKDQQIDPARYRLVDAAAEKLKHRTDHTFTWEEKDWRIGDARARLFLAIRGDQPSGFRRYLKLPEAWERDFRRLRLQRYLLPAVGGGIGLMLLVVFIQNLRSHPFRWKRYAAVGVPFCLLILAQFLNDWPGRWSNYNTAQSPQEFLADVTISLIVRALLAGFGVALAMLALEVFAGPRRFSNSPWTLAPAIAVAFGGAMRLISWGEQFVAGNRFSLPLWSPPPVDQWSPAVAVLLSATVSAALAGLLGSILATAAAGLFAPRKRLAYALTIALALALSRSDSPALVAYNFAAIVLLLALASLIVRTSGGAVAQWAAAVFGGQVILGAYKLFTQPNQELQTQGYLALVAGLAATAIWLATTRVPRAFSATPPAAPSPSGSI
ncbi:MAG: CPBP family intramembrane metalloprotease [Bryobacterales bacterium]|nr:CPBP family intramembrane metalloprotease [Bryobacterales bacterium]